MHTIAFFMCKSAQIYLAESYVNRTQFFSLEGLVAAFELWSLQHLCVLWRGLRTWLTSVEGSSGSSWPSHWPAELSPFPGMCLLCSRWGMPEVEEEQALSSVFRSEACWVVSVWPSSKLMQFEVCIKIKVVQVGSKRRDPAVDVSSPGGSKASTEWCQCMSPGWVAVWVSAVLELWRSSHCFGASDPLNSLQ